MNTLIVYYSLFQNTANLALEIAIQTGGTIRELIPDKNYSFDYNTAAKEVRNQISRGFCPKLISGNEPIEDYQTIFIGTPNWFKTLSPPVMSFLREHDFAGKRILPFCTHGGGGFGQIENDITKECSKSIILPGIAVNGVAEPNEVTHWLETIGYKNMNI
jgi:flavodoxin